jgi:hypothetical protein
MNIYSLTFILFVSCNSVGSDNQKNPILPDTAIKDAEIIKDGHNKIPGRFENDTTIIPLIKKGVILLDVRIDSTDKRELSVQKGMLVIDKIEIPTQEAIQGFAVNWIKETESGFEISIEYGGSSRYYHKDFRFYYEEGDFVLKDILINTFDKQNPEDEKSYTKKTTVLKVPIRFKLFKVEDFL